MLDVYNRTALAGYGGVGPSDDDFLTDDFFVSRIERSNDSHTSNIPQREVTGYAGSPTSAFQGDIDEPEEDEHELDRLLTNCRVVGNAQPPQITAGGMNIESRNPHHCLDGWQLSAVAAERAAASIAAQGHEQQQQQQQSQLGQFVRRQELRGVDMLRNQIAHAAHIFRDFASMVNDDKAQVDLLEARVEDVKRQTMGAVSELRKAHRRTQRVRRRRFIFMLLCLAASALLIWQWWPSSLTFKRISAPPPSSSSSVSPVVSIYPAAQNVPVSEIAEENKSAQDLAAASNTVSFNGNDVSSDGSLPPSFPEVDSPPPQRPAIAVSSLRRSPPKLADHRAAIISLGTTN